MTDTDIEMKTDRHTQEIQDRVRRHQLDANHTPNQVLADYVQSTSFQLNLGRTHIVALGHLARNDEVWRYQSLGNTAPAMRGLERRGLVSHSQFTGDGGRFGVGAEATVWDLTPAGKLVVMLLIEAGMLNPGHHGSPLPPPPPDWEDPRPKVIL